jgi:thioredoxin-like negative regulator of GroEL
MTPMLCATLVHAACLLTGDATIASTDATPVAVAPSLGATSYEEARRATERTGKPIVVMVSTDWCQPCQMMKRTILPRVRQRGFFRKVVLAMVNPDHDAELAEQITGGGPIPQLVMFRKTPRGWMRTKLIGSQSVEAVEQFINDGMVSNEPGKSEHPEKAAPSPKATHASGRAAATENGLAAHG